MATIQDYETCAQLWERIVSLIWEASAETDSLRLATPQLLARAMPELQAFPAVVRAAGPQGQ